MLVDHVVLCCQICQAV